MYIWRCDCIKIAVTNFIFFHLSILMQVCRKDDMEILKILSFVHIVSLGYFSLVCMCFCTAIGNFS